MSPSKMIGEKEYYKSTVISGDCNHIAYTCIWLTRFTSTSRSQDDTTRTKA